MICRRIQNDWLLRGEGNRDEGRFLDKLEKPRHLIDGYLTDNRRDISMHHGDIRKPAKLFYLDVGKIFAIFVKTFCDPLFESMGRIYGGVKLTHVRINKENGIINA